MVAFKVIFQYLNEDLIKITAKPHSGWMDKFILPFRIGSVKSLSYNYTNVLTQSG